MGQTIIITNYLSKQKMLKLIETKFLPVKWLYPAEIPF
jgi:hypothetical protein